MIKEIALDSHIYAFIYQLNNFVFFSKLKYEIVIHWTLRLSPHRKIKYISNDVN